MKTNRERGNALIYVLIAVALFAALSMVMSRQTDTGEAQTISDEKVELYATQMMDYASQAKTVVDQMIFTASTIDDLVFTPPNGTGFNTAPHTHKVYHPQGGGLNPGILPDEVETDSAATMTPGWYMGRFNNVEWTPSTGDDVLLAAYDIAESVCAKINEKITGSSTIPALVGVNLHSAFIDPAIHSSGAAADLDAVACASCEGKPAFCVTANGGYAFYSILEAQ